MKAPLLAGVRTGAPLLLGVGVALLGPRAGLSDAWVFGAGLAACFGGITAAVVAARRRQRDLQDLCEAAGRLGRGQVTPQVALIAAGEVAELARAFNAMARRIERTSDSPASLEARELLDVLEDVLELSHEETTELSVTELRSTLNRALRREEARSAAPPRSDEPSARRGTPR